MKVRKLVFLALLVALALAVSLIEGMIPVPIGVPGAKLGLSNIVLLVTLVLFGFREAFLVAVLKSVLLMLATGSVTSFFYSLSGAICASVAMGITQRCFTPPFSLVGVSEWGALFHNVGQLLVACVVLGNANIFLYLPVLTLLGVVTGFFVGLSAGLVSEHLNRVIQF